MNLEIDDASHYGKLNCDVFERFICLREPGTRAAGKRNVCGENKHYVYQLDNVCRHLV